MPKFVVFLTILLCLVGCEKKEPARVAPPAPSLPRAATYVGSAQCQTCHQAEQQAWLQSDHHKAMMLANKDTVLGNFAVPPLQHHHQATSFHTENNQYSISTDQGTPFAVTLPLQYTFGIYPLQQYLTALPNGRWQSLPFAWDSRPANVGGQRWFHLYAQEKITPNDVLHWRSPSQNANHMCIECHTTNFVKNYDSQNNSFQSSWQELGVGCESCHGPGSNHIAWAKNPQTTHDDKKGWDIALTSGSLTLWNHQTSTTMPSRKIAGDTQQIERCAQCHSRRSRISPNNNAQFLLDTFLPALLDESLYYPDGQIQDEVYEYGSFLQSKMAIHGVTCSNCHNPHSGKVKIEGNGLCLQCHDKKYDTPQHTLHSEKQAGSFCIDCHMPTRTYMTVDVRRDHSMRIPRPDLSDTLHTPNACTNCHTDKTADWAAKKIDANSGSAWRKPHYGEVIAQARLAQPSSYAALKALIQDNTQAAIVRATAIGLLSNFPTRDNTTLVDDTLSNADPLLRLGALRAAEVLPPEQQKILLPLLQDERLAIRVEAARLLAGNPLVQNNAAFDRARQEYIDSQTLNADRAASLTNLASLAIREQRFQEAETLLKTAIKREPYYIPASINLADFYRMQQRESDAEATLKAAMAIVPDNVDLTVSYALWLVRNQQFDLAVSQLKSAVQHSNDPHTYYLYALALSQQNKIDDALRILDKAAAMPIYSRDVQLARYNLAMQAQQYDKARKYLSAWQQLDTDDPAVQELLRRAQ
jgi:predicted CXXCH cytochrome family protein